MQRRVSGTGWQDAVAYQVFVRSFRDGDGDRIGDFAGLEDQLSTLGELGVTALWLNPIFPSHTHHNYFPTDFFDTDPEFGSLETFGALCRAAHGRGMALLIDMETQYFPDRHPWYRKAFNNPDSARSDWFLFEGDGNTRPVHLRLEMGPVTSAVEIPDVVTLNLDNPDVRAFQERVYAFWLDPLGEGDRASGVDGFRIDHVMDDLDGRGKLTDLFRSFWRPLVSATKREAPDLLFLAEPADWQSRGGDLLRETGMDAVFALPLMGALRNLDKAAIVEAVEGMLAALPTGKLAFTLLENHDVSRFASAVGGDPARLRVGAALLLTLPGVPTIYYGQELGMVGQVGGSERDWHIPAREAFKWTSDPDSAGMATWYRERGFWKKTALRDPEPPPFDAQRADPGSLWHLYRRLIALRHAHVALRQGDFVELGNDSDGVVAFARRYRDGAQHETVVVLVNLSAERQRTTLDASVLDGQVGDPHVVLLGDGAGRSHEDTAIDGVVELAAHEIRVLRVA